QPAKLVVSLPAHTYQMIIVIKGFRMSVSTIFTPETRRHGADFDIVILSARGIRDSRLRRSRRNPIGGRTIQSTSHAFSSPLRFLRFLYGPTSGLSRGHRTAWTVAGRVRNRTGVRRWKHRPDGRSRRHHTGARWPGDWRDSGVADGEGSWPYRPHRVAHCELHARAQGGDVRSLRRFHRAAWRLRHGRGVLRGRDMVPARPSVEALRPAQCRELLRSSAGIV